MSHAKKAIRGLLTVALVAIVFSGGRAARAEVVEHLKFPFTSVMPACNEFVELNGVIHTLTTRTFDRDGVAQITLHITIEAKGVGLTSGRTFALVQVSALEENVIAGLPFVSDAVTAFRLLPHWGGTVEEGLFLNAVLHFTVAPNGVTTAEVSHFVGDCN